MSNHFAKPDDRDPERLLLRLQPLAARRGPRPRRQVPTRRTPSSFCSIGESSDVRGLLLRGRQRGLAREASGRLRRPGQRLRDLGAEVRPDRQPHRVRQLLGLPQPEDHPLRRARRLRLVPRDARGGRVRPRRARAARSSTRAASGIHSHSNSDRQELYRTPEELEAAKAADPLPRFRKLLLETGLARRGRDRRASRRRTRRPTKMRRTAPGSAPEPDPATIHDFVVPEAVGPRGLAGRDSRRLGRAR